MDTGITPIPCRVLRIPDTMQIILHITWDDGQHYFSCGNWWESSLVKVTHRWAFGTLAYITIFYSRKRDDRRLTNLDISADSRTVAVVRFAPSLFIR